MMASSRKLVAEFVSVFVIGALAGAMVMWWYTDTQLVSFMSRTNNADTLTVRITQKYAAQYHFTPEEMTKVEPLIRELAEHMSQVRHRFGTDVISTLGDYHARIAAQLTPEHKAAYTAAMAEREKQLGSLLDASASTSAAEAR